MSYISWTDLVARYKKVSEDYDSGEAVAGFISGAEAELDSRLAIRYTVPFNPVPPMVKDLVIDMAYYRMFWQQDGEDKLRDFIERRIGALVAGSATLVVSGSVLPTNDVQAWSDRTGIRTVFGPDNPPNYSVSKSWQDNAKAERDND